MKTRFKFCVSLLLSALVFVTTSCSNNDPVDEPVPVELGVHIVQSKAAVNAVADFVSKVGVYGIKSNTWSATPVINNDQSTVNTTNGGITFSAGSYFYPAEGTALNFYAYHPFAATTTSGANYVTAPGAGTAPVLNFTITGQEDIMYATSVSGTKTVPVASALGFQHALTQLYFKAKTGTTFPTAVTVSSITFKSVNTKGTMNIADGSISGWSTPSTMTSAIVNAGAISTSTATRVGDPVMLQPGATSYTVDIVTSFGTFNNITITPSGGDTQFVAGKAYAVELTFTATGVTLSASVTAWVNTGTGTGTVQ